MTAIEADYNSFLEFIRSRRSLRRFQRKAVPSEWIDLMIESATWAPSAHNRQPWRFAIVESASQKVDLAKAMGRQLRHDLEADGLAEDLIRKDTRRSYERITEAPLLIVVCLSMSDMDSYSDAVRNNAEYMMAVQSTAMAGQNLLLMAHQLGLGACWMCAPLFCPEVVQASLELPLDWQPQGMIVVGFPAQSRKKERRSPESITLWR